MAHVSRKLNTALEGALAGGGDPATSPLYVFGPFLRLIVVAGVAQVTFGATIWLVVLTVAVVSAMYRLVMQWVTDGSGGSGLSEEAFGGWAVKLNAGITVVEYTLTFLVSMAALVTFLADRFPALNDDFLGIQYRSVVAVALSVLTGWLVNRGPKVAARTFGPATAGVLLLLWLMIAATIRRYGLRLPSVDWRAFTPAYINFTFNGYVRILAVMTGIEVFANLVAAYDGAPRERSRKAFGSLVIIMGTTCATMLVVGPAIAALADPLDPEVSVFTQTMDALLPAPLALAGTLVGVAVLLSASAASAQGLQNLALGLKLRHYIPAFFGERNRHGVADKPVWLDVAIICVCFVLFGTHEETYLALYAAGVFILLSMTGWAATRRLLREGQGRGGFGRIATLSGVIVAALLTSSATVIIFAERFREGAWFYFVVLPFLYAQFTYFRRQLGEPSRVDDRLGGLLLGSSVLPADEAAWTTYHGSQPLIQRLLLPLDGSPFAEHALPPARLLAQAFGAPLTLVRVVEGEDSAESTPNHAAAYLDHVAELLRRAAVDARPVVLHGHAVRGINRAAREHRADLIIISTHGHTGMRRLMLGSVAEALVQTRARPVLLVRPAADDARRADALRRLLVALDGSSFAEQALPYAEALALALRAEVVLLSVLHAPDDAAGRAATVAYVDGIAAALGQRGVAARGLVTGAEAAATIVAEADGQAADLIVLATRGRGGLERLLLGSVATAVVRDAPCPVLLIPT